MAIISLSLDRARARTLSHLNCLSIRSDDVDPHYHDSTECAISWLICGLCPHEDCDRLWLPSHPAIGNPLLPALDALLRMINRSGYVYFSIEIKLVITLLANITFCC